MKKLIKFSPLVAILFYLGFVYANKGWAQSIPSSPKYTQVSTFTAVAGTSITVSGVNIKYTIRTFSEFASFILNDEVSKPVMVKGDLSNKFGHSISSASLKVDSLDSGTSVFMMLEGNTD